MLIDEIKVMGEFHNDMKYVPEKGCYHGAFPPLYGFDPEDREGSTDQCAVALFEKLGLFGSKVTSHDLVSSALQAYMSIATAINHKFFNFIFSGIL